MSRRCENIVDVHESGHCVNTRNIKFTSFSAKLTATWSLVITVIVMMICMQAHTANATGTLCDPEDPSTCSFGGTCTSVSTLNRLINGVYKPNLYLCICEPIDCNADGFDLVCGSDGRTHLNNACRRARECVLQQRIEPLCRGRCDSPTCTPIEDNGTRCPERYSGYCFNFGECVMNPDSPDQAYCRCLDGFVGERCQMKTPRGNKRDNVTRTCLYWNDGSVLVEDVNYKLAFLCCLGVLALILILQTAYCILRCRDTSDKSENYCVDDAKCVDVVKDVWNKTASDGDSTENGKSQLKISDETRIKNDPSQDG